MGWRGAYTCSIRLYQTLCKHVKAKQAKFDSCKQKVLNENSLKIILFPPKLASFLTHKRIYLHAEEYGVERSVVTVKLLLCPLYRLNNRNIDAGPLPMTAGPSQYAGPSQLSGFSQLAISTQYAGPSKVGGAGPPPAPVSTADFNPWTSKTFIGDLLHDAHL